MQGEIKRLIQQLCKSQNEAARLIYTETNDFDDEDEIKRFEGRFKKQLGAIKPKSISAFIAADMRKLSEELDFSNE